MPEVWALEEISVVEDVVELVEGQAVGGIFGEGPFVVVGGIECGWESAEEASHGEVAFPIGEVCGGIEDEGGVVCEPDVTGPEVAMDEGRLWGVVLEKIGNFVEKLSTVSKGVAISFGEGELRSNS